MTWLALVFALLVFALDVALLSGHGEAVLYVVVVLIFLWSTHWRYVPWVAALCTLLTAFGFWFGTGDGMANALWTNHVFSFAAIWLTALLGMWSNHLSDKLGDSEMRMRATVETASEGIMTTDDRGQIETCNPAAATMFRFDADELIGVSIQRLVPELPEAEVAKSFRESLETSKLLASSNTKRGKDSAILSSRRNTFGVCRDTTKFPILIDIREMRLHDKRLFAVIVMDMTELQAAQSSAIQSARLAAIGEAMAGLAHESRNALQRSQAALEMLAREIDDSSDAAELIGRVQVAQEDLHTLYEEVRGYAAPLKLNLQPYRLDKVMADAWEKLELVRGERDVVMVQRGDDLDLTREVDSFILRRAFRNLLENSLAATDDPVRIDVEYSKTDLHGQPAFQIVLRDNGPGIGADVLDRMFEPFFTTKTTGTGLGMPIVRRYIEAHGGTIVAVASSSGAAFRMTLPRSEI